MQQSRPNPFPAPHERFMYVEERFFDNALATFHAIFPDVAADQNFAQIASRLSFSLLDSLALNRIIDVSAGELEMVLEAFNAIVAPTSPRPDESADSSRCRPSAPRSLEPRRTSSSLKPRMVRNSSTRVHLTAAHEHFEHHWTGLPTTYKHLSAAETYEIQPSSQLVELTGQLDAIRRPTHRIPRSTAAGNRRAQ